MSQVAKLKKQAADFELKKQFDKALPIYVKLLDLYDQYSSEIDVALFNRVGDLMLRQGNVADAVDYYEKAVDRYAETGFFNNAIALCNKVLRQSPGRTSIYYKLGRISAQKGFKAEARANFLEYSDRMRKAGNHDEAFRALEEFADLAPDQYEIRQMLADQLIKAGRNAEAIEQLQLLHERYDGDGRDSDAKGVAARLRSLDPNATPRSSGGRKQRASSDLVFIDLDEPAPRTPASVQPVAAPPIAKPPLATPPLASPPPPPLATVESIIETAALESTLIEPAGLEGNLVEATADEPTFIQPTLVEPTSIEPLVREALTRQPLDAESVSLESSLVGSEQFESVAPAEGLLDPVSGEPTPAPSTAVAPTPTIIEPIEPPAMLLGFEATNIISSDDPLGLSAEVTIDIGLNELATPPRDFSPVAIAAPTPDSPNSSLPDLPAMDIGDALLARPTPVASAAVAPEPFSGDSFELAAPSTDATNTPDDDTITIPTPSIARRSTLEAEHVVDALQLQVDQNPTDWNLRRSLAEAMLDAGNRDAGIRELEAAMAGAERSGDLDLASAIAEEISRLEPEVIKHQQKRVEYAFRTNDRPRLIEAYLALADVLLRTEQIDKARTIYERVLDLSPDETRARAGLQTVGIASTPAPSMTPMGNHRLSGAIPAPRNSRPVRREMTPSAGGFVNLGDLLRDEEVPRDTRMVVPEQEPTGDEEADFADMLRKFKQGIAENVDPQDYQSHYDLAIAFKEMGLIDEAIGEFQKALGSSTNRLPAYEALGQCFMDKGQFKLASSILTRALTERASDDQLVGVLYLLGRASEALGNNQDAINYYQRVFVVDIQFRDIAQRMHEVERAWR
ncbi:MAG TPA: tetratricopeptide repeat protein [Gemmatimonadaceae bacterium]|nr:tetratricopeptide repeat protein [Gemmatimonadaceae bacterium]